MTPRRAPLSRTPPHVSQAPIVDQATTEEFRDAMTVLVNAMAQRATPTPVSKVRNFTRMNPSEFLGSKVDDDPLAFIEGVGKILDIMGATLEEKAELGAYQFRDMAQVWFEQWKANNVREGARIGVEDDPSIHIEDSD